MLWSTLHLSYIIFIHLRSQIDVICKSSNIEHVKNAEQERAVEVWLKHWTDWLFWDILTTFLILLELDPYCIDIQCGIYLFCSSFAAKHGFSVCPYSNGHGIGSIFHALPDICHVGMYKIPFNTLLPYSTLPFFSLHYLSFHDPQSPSCPSHTIPPYPFNEHSLILFSLFC